MSLDLAHYCVFGNPIHHSKSPLIHAMFAKQTAQSMDYQANLVPLDGFAASVQQFMNAGGKGANVTVPFKLEAYALSDQLSARAAMAGAVNTLTFSDGAIVGDNTDGIGLVCDITKNAATPIRGRRVLLLGAGGAARGALLPLLEEQPASLMIANRTLSKALDLVQLAVSSDGSKCQIEAKTWEQLDSSFDLIINATSASLQSEVPPIPASVFASPCLAYDMMYADTQTSFNRYAQQYGAATRDGLGMLIEQAAEAFFIWRGIRPDTKPVFDYFRSKEGA
ncbi:shikimate dehydrogenase [Undibacterium seohonense]|uniref:Shikimate dehydrogenase (NADP(+)) n=1 Tax=Undibacterium seohonense TaxID=1344950 RepID=A0ABR6X880_9BURK|nr:shikimate dehydrogenase [Undibacterium seohonense]MBC3809122.1 shikimate dehydrogenase [Undibacterium seohonense]